MAVVHKAPPQMPMAVARAAIVFCVAVAPPVVFQFLFALGAPWGALTMVASIRDSCRQQCGSTLCCLLSSSAELRLWCACVLGWFFLAGKTP